MKPALQNKAVALFVRHPVPGQVKTRLARDIGNENACQFYQAMVKDILCTISSSHVPLYLFHDGSDSTGLPQPWLDAACSIVAQHGHTIGERMTEAFKLLFSQNKQQVILLGSDIPGIETHMLLESFEILESDDIAIVPATDGGYCLIAIQQTSFDDRIFQDIEWSTERVLQTTLERIDECGLRVTLLASRQDIDTCEDLQTYSRKPAKSAHATNQWLIEKGYVCVSS